MALTITNAGSLLLVQPSPEVAVDFWDWADDNLPQFQTWSGALVVEPRYLADLLDGLAADGFDTKEA